MQAFAKEDGDVLLVNIKERVVDLRCDGDVS
jgi:hypothetical protein